MAGRLMWDKTIFHAWDPYLTTYGVELPKGNVSSGPLLASRKKIDHE